MSMHGPMRTSDDMDQVPRGGFGIGQQRYVRLCRLDVIATHRERERERERERTKMMMMSTNDRLIHNSINNNNDWLID